MKHQYWTAGECACDRPHCNICMGGLALCKVCGLYEGGLTTDCPGVPSQDRSDDVYAGRLDFRNGEWVEEVSAHMAHAYPDKHRPVAEVRP